MFDIYNRDTHWGLDPWEEVKVGKQIFHGKVQQYRPRLREIHRDFKIINRCHQWEPRHFLRVLDASINLIKIPKGYTTGRPSLLPPCEQVKMLCIKQFYQFGARRAVHLMESANKQGYLYLPTEIPQNFFNRINDYMDDERLTDYLINLIRVTSEHLKDIEHFFCIDSTGFKISSGKRRYKDIRTDMSLKREYISLHAICGTKYKIIPAVIVTKGSEHDSKFLPPLVFSTKT